MESARNSTIASYLAGLVDRIGTTPFPDQDRRIIRQHLLDAFASAWIGCRNKVFQDLVQVCPKIPKGSIWPGSGKGKVHPLDSAMLWAYAINASVFEDGSREGACHPAAVVIPTVVAFSQGKDWETIDRAVIAGYDVMVRLARGGNPGFTRKGFHPTAITAPFGAAAAASLLMRLDPPRIQNGLCLAALASAGLMASFRIGQTQPLQVAWSVRSGIMAALMSGSGNEGYPRMIEDGFYPAYLGTPPHPEVDAPLQFEYAVKGSYLKSYPGCRHVHPSIDAFAKVMKENRIDASRIEKIRVRTYKIAVETEIEPVNSRGDAYFNIPYALAARITLGRNDWDAFDEKHFTNKSLLELMKKIEVHPDPEIEALYPRERGSIVEVHMVGGKVFSGKVNHPSGEPENPLPDSIVLEKFREASKPFLTEKTMDHIETILNISGPADSAERLFESLAEDVRAQ